MGMKTVMKRVLSFGAIVGAALVVGLTPAPRSTAAEAPQPRPNIVVIMADDQTVESMRVMANVNAMLGEQGTTFADNYVSFPLCCPSRTTLLTGQYGHNHTVMGNAPPQGGYEKLAPTHANTLPAWLKLAGYHTVHIGKYLNGYGRQRPTEVPPGWDEWFGSVDPSTYRFYDYTLNENGKLVRYGTGADDYQADVYTAKAVDAVKRLAGRTEPFFLSVAYLAPHSGGPRESDDPANLATPVPAPRHRNRFAGEPLPRTPAFNEADVSDKPLAVRRRPLFGTPRINGITEMYRQRLESLLAVDEGVAAIVRALQDSGELARTLFVYTADNGFFHGEHRIPSGKVQHYEPSARVPLVMRGPGVPRGVRVTQPSVNIDLAPTLVDAANAKVGRATDGVSLLALLADRTRFVGRDVLLETPTYAAIHTPRYVYVEHNTGERELYDLASDPYELASLHESPAHAQIRSDLARRLLALRACKAADCRRGPALSVSSRFAGGRHRVAVRGC
jgi:N-acetylglucosamine-6-sulfatase